ESSGGMLSSGRSKFHQACGAPLVAEVGVGTFVDGPVGVGDNETHARLLYTRVALGETRKGSSPQDTPRGSKLKIVGNWQPALRGWHRAPPYLSPYLITNGVSLLHTRETH